jgi:hypothetical protein
MARHLWEPSQSYSLSEAALAESLRRTESYMARERFRGYDPYDALLSPLFRLPILRSNKVARLGAQQVLRRLPVNIRPLLRIPRGYNPVTLGLALQGYAYLNATDAERADYHRAQALFCLDELKRLRTPGYSGGCWGYDFPWTARYGDLGTFTPTIVATGIITNALFRAYELLGIEEAFALCQSAASFVLRDLQRMTYPDGSFCWGYFPSDRQRVINATMKGARLCAQVHSVSGDEELAEAALLTARFAAQHQRADGAWPYAVEDPRDWVDNFHTGYILESFKEYARLTGDRQFDEVVSRGWNYYRAHFFDHDCVPRYFDTKTYPVDVTACAESVIVLSEFADDGTRDRVASWVIGNMQKPDGSFIYQIRRRHTNRIAYMRWGTAWMFAALGHAAHARRHADHDLEQPKP